MGLSQFFEIEYHSWVKAITRLSLAIFLLGIVTFFSACQILRPKAAQPKIGKIYAGAAKREDIHRNAVIVIPGILGSRLVNEPTEQIVWGAFTRQAANPRQAESARIFAHPMAVGQRLDQLTDTVRPRGALDRFKVSVFSGFSLQPKAYLEIMNVLGVGGFRDESLSASYYEVDYGSQHYTCFQFGYDWRRSSAENAALLGQFIREKKAYIEGENLKNHNTKGQVKFNIVAHSMGALVTRYYLRYGEQGMPATGEPSLNWAGTKNIEKVIMVGPPNAGSVLMLQRHVGGLDLGPFTFKYPPAIVGTMPATYELLPRARHRALKDTVLDIDLDPLDPQVWIDRQWGLAAPDQDEVLQKLLPEVATREERYQIALDHLAKCLRNADRFQKAIDSPQTPPAHLRLVLFAGDAADTAIQAEAWPGRIKFVDFAPGDNTVARYSALMDERQGVRSTKSRFKSPIPWDQVTFLSDSHLGLTQSRTFADNVLFELLEK